MCFSSKYTLYISEVTVPKTGFPSCPVDSSRRDTAREGTSGRHNTGGRSRSMELWASDEPEKTSAECAPHSSMVCAHRTPHLQFPAFNIKIRDIVNQGQVTQDKDCPGYSCCGNIILNI